MTASGNDVLNCKHTISTSERKAKSYRIRINDNLLRQRGDWEYLEGGYVLLGNLDVHVNVDSVEIRGNTLESWGRYNFSMRNGNFEMVNNHSIIHTQTGLPFSQQHIGFAEAFIKRCFVSGNQFETPDAALVAYYSHRSTGLSGSHSNMMWVNSFENGIFRFQDSSGTNYNTMVDIMLVGNRFHRTGGTPLFFAGPISNMVMSGNIVRYGAGVCIHDRDTRTDADWPTRQDHISGNSFQRDGGSGYDVNIQSGPTNIVLLGQNKFSAAPVNGITELGSGLDVRIVRGLSESCRIILW